MRNKSDYETEKEKKEKIKFNGEKRKKERTQQM